jgi:hypothetical protein
MRVLFALLRRKSEQPTQNHVDYPRPELSQLDQIRAQLDETMRAANSRLDGVLSRLQQLDPKPEDK